MPVRITARSMIAAGALIVSTMTAGVAHGQSEDRARAATAAAQGKIDAAAKAGASEKAADILARAKTAAANADREVKEDDDEDAAWHYAREASALADLALATTELRTLEAERDRLRALAQ